MHKILLVPALLCTLLFPVNAGGVGESESPEGAEKRNAGGRIKTVVSIPPQAFFVRAVGGDAVEVSVLVKPGQSPHAYEPTPSQMGELSAADILFTIGVEFEKSLIPRIRSNLPDLRIVETQKGIAFRYLDTAGGEHGEHEDTGHEEGALDPHIWMSPENGKIIADTIKEALIKARPESAAFFEKNYRELAEIIDDLDRSLKEVLGPLEGETLFVFHPAFGYFADAYGLNQEAIETGGKEPGPRELTRIIDEAGRKGVKVIFVQPQFSRRSAETVADAVGGVVVPIDPLAEDWMENLGNIAETVKRYLSEDSP